MIQRPFGRIAVAGMAFGLLCQLAWSQVPPATPDYGAFLKQYCVTCHNDKLKTDGLSLEKISH